MKKILISLTALVSVLLSSCGNGGDEVRVDLLPVKLADNGKWSMVDNKGNIRYEDEFKNVPSAVVEGYFTASEKDGYCLYRASAKKPEEVGGCSGLKYAGHMRNGLMPVTRKDSRISVIGTDGKDRFELTPVKGREIVMCQPAFSEDLLLFRTDEDMYGYYSTGGKVAIAPAYDMAMDFSEGKAVVGKKSGKDGEIRYSVIDRSGKELFRVKDRYDLAGGGFSCGWLVASDGDRTVLMDEKGEVTRLPAKVAGAVPMQKDILAFRDHDGQWGLMRTDGEILVRAKYEAMYSGGGNTFFAMKDKDEVDVLHDKGEVKESLDFKFVGYVNGIGNMGYDGKVYQILDSKFKPIGDEFKDVNINLSLCNEVRTDYFNFGSVISTVSEQLDEALKQFPIGASADKVMAGQKPSAFSYSSSYKPEDLSRKLFNYQAQVEVSFSSSLADYNWSPATYSGDYFWNSTSTVNGINVQYECEHWLSLVNHKEMVAEFKKKSYNVVKEGMLQGSYAAVLKKGDIGMIVLTKATRGAVIVGKANAIDAFCAQVEGKYVEQTEGESSSSFDSGSIEMPETSVAVEEAAIDTVAVDSDYDF